jgi:rhomboid protease GluP
MPLDFSKVHLPALCMDAAVPITLSLLSMRRPPGILEVGHFPVTGGTAGLAIGVSLAKFFGVDVSALFTNVALRQGELWRLLTAVLPHANFVHLLFNLYWLWVFGSIIEETFRQVRTFLLYLLLGAAPMAAEYALLRGGIGLSGMGYGLFGMLLVLSRRDLRFEGVVDANTAGIFVAWFFLCIGLTVTKIVPITNIAHGVGAILGFLIGVAVVSRSPMRQILAAATGLVAVARIVGAVYARGWINYSHNGYGESLLGYRALEADDNAAAVRWLRDAVRIEPDNAYHWHNLGIAYLRLDRRDEAADAMRRAAALNSPPTTSPAR